MDAGQNTKITRTIRVCGKINANFGWIFISLASIARKPHNTSSDDISGRQKPDQDGGQN